MGFCVFEDLSCKPQADAMRHIDIRQSDIATQRAVQGKHVGTCIVLASVVCTYRITAQHRDQSSIYFDGDIGFTRRRFEDASCERGKPRVSAQAGKGIEKGLRREAIGIGAALKCWLAQGLAHGDRIGRVIGGAAGMQGSHRNKQDVLRYFYDWTNEPHSADRLGRKRNMGPAARKRRVAAAGLMSDWAVMVNAELSPSLPRSSHRRR